MLLLSNPDGPSESSDPLSFHDVFLDTFSCHIHLCSCHHWTRYSINGLGLTLNRCFTLEQSGQRTRPTWISSNKKLSLSFSSLFCVLIAVVIFHCISETTPAHKRTHCDALPFSVAKPVVITPPHFRALVSVLN